MVQKTPTVSIVIRALNEARHLPRLLHSLQNQTIRPDEIILVDSGSTDESMAIAREWGLRIVEIEPLDFTFGYSLNSGCEVATGELLVFVSAHVYPSSVTWLERLINPLRSDSRIAISYGGQDGDHTSNYAERRLLSSWFPDESNWNQPYPFCNNANCAVRRDLWIENRYDESLPGLEDIAWASTIQALGHRIAYASDARIVHLHRESFAGIRNRYDREAEALQSILSIGELDRATAARWLAKTLVLDLREAKKEKVLLRKAASSAKFRAAQFLGGASEGFGSNAEFDPITRRMFDPDGLSLSPRSPRQVEVS